MATPPTKKPNDAFAYLLSSQREDAKLMRIATLADFQVGVPDNPAELQVTGRFSQSTAIQKVSPNQTVNFPNNATIFCVLVENPQSHTQVTVNLPSSPRQGQTCYVKDVSGTADVCNIKIQSTTAEVDTNLIDFKNGCLCFVWTGSSWSSVSSSGASKIIEKTIVEEKTTEIINNISGGGGGGTGDVVGPASSTDNAVVRFDSTSGKLIKNSGVTIDNSSNITTPGRVTVTGGTTSYTDAILGNAAVGSFPYFDGGASSGVYAMFAHKDLDNSTGATNYALYQDNNGNTAVNASTTKTLYLAINNTAMGAFTDDLLGTGIPAILLTGDLSTRTNVGLGNTTGASSTLIYAGTGGISLTGSATTSITGSSSGQAELLVGTVEIGEFPYTKASFPRYYAMFGHKTLDHSVNGNYALVQSYTGDSFLNSPTTIYLQNAGNLIGYLDNDNISLTGQASTSVTSEFGSNYNLSSTSIKGGQFGIQLSASFIIITSSYPTQNLGADAKIGAVELGSLPGFANQYAMFGHEELDHTLGNYAIVQKNDGTTYLNSSTEKPVYFTTAGNASTNGYIYYSSFFGKTLIDLQGRSGSPVTLNLGNLTGDSTTNIYGGSGNVNLSGSSISLDSSENGYVYFKSNNNQIGYLGFSSFFNKSLIVLQGRSGYATNSTFGNSTSDSSTSVYGGSGGIILSSSAGYTTITGSTSNTAEVIIGAAEIGELPATRATFPSVYAFFGHKALDHSSDGNYALVQSNVGDTFLGAASNKTISFKNGTDFIGTLDHDTVSFTGKSSTATTTTIGNTASTSVTTINAGSGDILISASLGDVILGTPNIRSTGRVGIGTSTPSYKLDVQTDIAAGWAASFFNDGNATNRYGIRVQSGTDTTTGDLIDFYDGDGTLQGTISFNAGTVTYGAFTGDHYARINDVYTEKVYGTIVKVVSTNSEPGRKNINYVVEKTTSAKDPAVFGVYAASLDASPDESLRDCHSIFSLGDGHILVTDEGGNIEIGDYICSSNIPGHGMKQDDDLLHSYTVAKATQAIDFSTEQPGPYGYKSVLITCTYHAS